MTPKESKVLEKAREFGRAARELEKVRRVDKEHAHYGDRIAALDREDSTRRALLDEAKDLP